MPVRLRLGFADRLAAFSAIVLAAAIAISGVAASVQVRQAMMDDAGKALDGGAATLRSLIRAKAGTDVPTTDGNGLAFGAFRLDGDTALVDAVSRSIGGNATVFAGDVRVSTSARRPDGGRATGTTLTDPAVREAVIVQDRPYRGEANVLGSPYLTLYEPLRDADGRRVGILYVGVPKAAFLSAVDALYRSIALAGLAATLLGAVAVRLAVGRSVRPLRRLREAMVGLREGRLDTEVPMTGRRDIVGSMARAVDRFKEGLVEREAMRLAAEGEADRAEAVRKAEAIRLAAEIEAEVGAAVAELAQAAGMMRKGVEDARAVGLAASAKAAAVATASAESSGNVQVVAAASEEMAATIREIADLTARSADGTRRAAGEMAGVDTSMADLTRTAAQVEEVLSTLATLASQTNLLALNATIEAARAGQAGKGFAVVAAEVKALANQSAEAGRQVGEKIAAMKAVVGATVEQMGRTAGIVRTIDGDMASIAATVQQQGAATGEITVSMARVAVAVDRLAGGVSAMGEDVDRSAAAVGANDVLAGGVLRLSGDLEARMQGVVARLRAA